MNGNLILLLAFLNLASLTSTAQEKGYIRYEPVRLTDTEKQTLAEMLQALHQKYDPQEQMLTKELSGYNYHTDAESGVFHEVRSSMTYAVGLLDLGNPQYQHRAFEIIRKVISLQDTVRAHKTYGIWPYYLEEPLATKKSPADWNWADFNGVALLDVYMGHQQKLPADLKLLIKNALISAAESIQKRNVQPGYTNIAIMGTYMTYLTSHLFGLPEMQTYATRRLQSFYDYTLKRGFTEYNSPTYTIVALDELARMREHIVEKDTKPKLDSLYNLAWGMVARHHHQPSGQWAGPHSRSYSSLVRASVNGILKQASDGKINLPGAVPRSDVKIKHTIPTYLMPYFLSPKYPRTEHDMLVTDTPRILGTSYLTERFALSTSNRSSLWNQRRPFLAYWGTVHTPRYLQARFLLDNYDFSSASFYSDQQENNVLAAINFLTNGGNKHISIDRVQNGKITAKDLRLRFEFGNTSVDKLSLPTSTHSPFRQNLDGLEFHLQLYFAAFDTLKGHWEKGSDATGAWIDFVLYSGEEKSFDLTTINEAALGFSFTISDANPATNKEEPVVLVQQGTLSAMWKGMNLSIPLKPAEQPKNL